MSIGNQVISFKYFDPLTARVVNKRYLNIIPKGIYGDFSVNYTVGNKDVSIFIESVECVAVDKDINSEYYNVKIDFRNEITIDTTEVYQSILSDEFYVILEMIYEDKDDIISNVIFKNINDVISINQLKICRIKLDTNKNVESIDISNFNSNNISTLLSKNIYDSNNDGIIDNVETALGKPAISGQDIIDGIIDPVNYPDNLVSIRSDGTGKFPAKIFSVEKSVKMFTVKPLIVNISNSNNGITEYQDIIDISNIISAEATGVILKFVVNLTRNDVRNNFEAILPVQIDGFFHRDSVDKNNLGHRVIFEQVRFYQLSTRRVIDGYVYMGNSRDLVYYLFVQIQNNSSIDMSCYAIGETY